MLQDRIQERVGPSVEPFPLVSARPRLRFADARDVSSEAWAESVELLRIAFNGGPSWFANATDPVDHLVWKLVDFPGASRTYFSTDGGTLVGFLATPARTWLVRGQPRTGTDMVDAALHPSVQGKVLVNMFRSLRREIIGSSETDFCFSFASHPALLRNRGFQGKHDLGATLDTYVRPLDLLRYVRSQRGTTRAVSGLSRTRIQIELEKRRTSKPTVVRFLGWKGRLLRQRLQRTPLALVSPTPYDITTRERFDERIDEFFERAATEFDVIQQRDARFLNWRYADERAGRFTVRVAESDGHILGYIVLRTGKETLDIADLLVLPDREDVAHALLRDALTQARSEGAAAIRSWMMRDHPYEPLLADLGFVRIRTSTKPVLHPSPRTDPEELAFLQEPTTRVHLMLGDSDHV